MHVVNSSYLLSSFMSLEQYKVPLRLIMPLMEMAAKPNLQRDEKPEFECLKERLSVANQAYLKTLFKLRNAPRFMVVSDLPFSSPFSGN